MIIGKTASLKVGECVNPGGETQPCDVMPIPCSRFSKHEENKMYVFSAIESMATHQHLFDWHF